MKKRVCHVTSVHSRYDVRIFQKECRSLAKNGYEVYLVVNDRKGDEIIDGVQIISTGYLPSGRISRFLLTKRKIKKKLGKTDAQIYHFHDPELLPLASALARKGKKVIFDSHEDVPEQIKDKEWLPRSIRKTVSSVYSLYEKHALKKYNAVISVTPHIVERLGKYNKNTIMLTNYPILGEPPADRLPERKICFAGGIEAQWNHDKIIEAMGKIKDTSYVLAGRGSREYLDYLKSFKEWENVIYLGKIPFEKVKNIYSRCMAGIALNYSRQAEGQGTLGNTKLFEYMEAGLPVICTDYTLWKEIVNKNQCGIVVSPFDSTKIAEAIQYIIDNPETAMEMGKNGRAAAEREYNWNTQEKKLLALYNAVLG